MINVVLHAQDNRIKGFTISGHAGMEEAGKDLLCAAVSAISQTALLGLDDALSVKPQWRIEQDGYLECWIPEGLSAAEAEAARIILRTMELGLQCLQQDYGAYLKVSKRRWTPCCSK